MKILKKLFKSSLVYMAIFSLSGFLVSQVINLMEKEEISRLGYRNSKIEGFILSSVGKENYTMEGKSIVDYGRKIYINSPIINIKDRDGKTEVKSKEALYFPNKETVFLLGDVMINSDDTVLSTQRLVILVQKSLAYNDTDNTIYSKNIRIEGKNLLFDIKSKNMMLNKVKTEVYRSDG
ncbi:MAG: LPS export ABC transporter periplasmic protein LptC [Hydrogenothermaceae bacterium]|nr:LPS export ABC transporter periplasmic protein LptC [Hydrogenothermaceae bacterium]